MIGWRERNQQDATNLMFILIINIRLVAYCWFLCLHPTFMMHGHKSLKFWMIFKSCAQLSPEFKFKALHHTA